MAESMGETQTSKKCGKNFQISPFQILCCSMHNRQICFLCSFLSKSNKVAILNGLLNRNPFSCLLYVLTLRLHCTCKYVPEMGLVSSSSLFSYLTIFLGQCKCNARKTKTRHAQQNLTSRSIIFIQWAE